MTTTITGATGIDNIKAATGAVLQVIQSVNTTYLQSTSTSFVDSGLTGTITPSSTTSKILVMISAGLGNTTQSTNNNIQIVRGSTTVYTNSRIMFSSAGHAHNMQSFQYLDSPSSTAAITYKLQLKIDAGAIRFNDSSGGTPTSTITLMEIAG